MGAVHYRNFIWALSSEPQEMLCKDGIVLARSDQVNRQGAETIDFNGRYVLPAMVDPHCHILPTGLDLKKLHLGSASSQADVLDLVSQRSKDQPEGWLMAVHYDQNRYPGGHLHRDQLDAIAPDRPVLLRHVNGHAGVANSAALRAANIDEQTLDPSGGEFVRDASGRLTGVLLEHALGLVDGAAPKPTKDQMIEAILAAARSMHDLGLCSASDMLTGQFNLDDELDAYAEAIRRGAPLHFRLFISWGAAFGGRAKRSIEQLKAIHEVGGNGATLRVAGIKLFADGAIGSATAGIYGTYSGVKAPGPQISKAARDASSTTDKAVSGQLIYTPEKLRERILVAHDSGFPVSVHSIGDYSTDVVMDAFAATEEPSRHRVEHAMLMSDLQIERFKSLGLACTFQPEFLIRFGHTYRAQLGTERANKLERIRSFIDAGIPIALSSDRPIVAGDPWDAVCAASRRPDGFDQEENISRKEALLGVTEWAAKISNDEHLIGSLLPDQRADFLVSSQNPMTENHISFMSLGPLSS